MPRPTLMFCFFLLVFVLPVTSEAALRLEVAADGVMVYSGPSRRFRPIMRAGKGRKFVASSSLAQGPGEEFYKVVVVSKRSKRKRIGYISTKEPVAIIGESEETEELTQIRTLAQAESSIQLATWFLKDSRFFWSAAYQKYFAPELYFAIYVGQFFNKQSSSLATGGEIGLDQELAGAFSLFTQFRTGVVIVSNEDVLFQNSGNFNYSVVGSGGLRYHADEYASVSFGIGQGVVFNQNNSWASHVLGFTVEVGL